MREIFQDQWVPRPVEEVFQFFCDERNLEALTPPWLRFEVLGKSTAEIGEGTLIDYRLSLRGIPMRWRTRIEEWVPNRTFVDTQLKGPYALWHHRHDFEAVNGGTRMKDHVQYRLPFGALGDLVAGAWVSRDVEKIFAYRHQIIADRFGRA